MAFEQVNMRVADGTEYGPVSWDEFAQWFREGRVPPNACLIDTATGEARAVAAFPQFAVPPPPLAGNPGLAQAPAAQAPTAMDHLIPAKNSAALIAYYLGICSFFCGLIAGPIAIVLGVKGVKKARELGVGKTHAIVGIIGGSFALLVWLGLGTLILIAALSHS